MKQAVEKVLRGQLSIRKAAEIYNIPQSTLIIHISAVKRGKEITFTPALGRFKPTFNAEFEGVLLDHVKDLSDRLLPFTRKEFLNLAFQLAEALKIPHKFNRDKKTAAEGGRSVTVLFCMNAGGQYIPHFLRHRMNERLLIGAPKESIGEAQSNGWMTSHLWALDEKESRCKDEYARASVVGDAFARVSRAEIAIKGFKCTGIHPLNPDVFTELDYLPSMMTDIGMDSNVDQTESPTVRPMLPFPAVTSAPETSSHHETSPNRPTPTDRPNDTTILKETIQQLC
ncbi:hypothetical protein ANN_13801, partial [Periplaneta americana]